MDSKRSLGREKYQLHRRSDFTNLEKINTLKSYLKDTKLEPSASPRTLFLAQPPGELPEAALSLSATLRVLAVERRSL